MRVVKFRRHWRLFNAGEVAGIGDRDAAYLVESGGAEYHDESEPEPNPEPKPDQSPGEKMGSDSAPFSKPVKRGPGRPRKRK